MTKDEFNHYGVSISLKSNNSKLARINRYNNKSLFRLITLSSILIYIICSVLFFKPGHASLSLSTRETVVGSAPYLTLDNGKTKITDVNDLVSFSFKDDKGITYTLNKSTNTTTPEKPFVLPPNSVKTFGDFDFPLIRGYPISQENYQNFRYVVHLHEPYFNDYFRDDDGDEITDKWGALDLRIYRNIEAIHDSLKLSDELNPCEEFYEISVIVHSIHVFTKYGYPQDKGIESASSTFYVRREPPEPLVCWATPNLVDSNDDIHRSSQWDNEKGFFLQDINEPAKNFPTVGAHGLFFDLIMAGALSKDVSYTKQPSDSNISLDLSLKENENSHLKKLNVKLVGPKDGVSKTNASVKPTTFIIYAGTEKKVPIYSFTISKWFILKPGLGEGYESSKAYCNNIGYQIPSVSDFTNANSYVYYPYWNKGFPGQGNQYLRRIGGGLLAEWGEILQNYYQNIPIIIKTDFYVFWAREEAKYMSSRLRAYYDANDGMHGHIGYNWDSTDTHRAMCVSP